MTLEQVTAAAIKATDAILADIKKRGHSVQFYTTAKKEEMRQEWISAVTKAILEAK